MPFFLFYLYFFTISAYFSMSLGSKKAVKVCIDLIQWQPSSVGSHCIKLIFFFLDSVGWNNVVYYAIPTPPPFFLNLFIL